MLDHRATNQRIPLMNTPNENTENITKPRRPGFWLRAIEHRKHRLTREYRATLGDTAREGISDQDYATTMATLEKMARNLGWNDDDHAERGFGRGRGFGPGFGPAFGPGRRPFSRGHGHDRPAPEQRGDVADNGTEA